MGGFSSGASGGGKIGEKLNSTDLLRRLEEAQKLRPDQTPAERKQALEKLRLEISLSDSEFKLVEDGVEKNQDPKLVLKTTLNVNQGVARTNHLKTPTRTGTTGFDLRGADSMSDPAASLDQTSDKVSNSVQKVGIENLNVFKCRDLLEKSRLRALRTDGAVDASAEQGPSQATVMKMRNMHQDVSFSCGPTALQSVLAYFGYQGRNLQSEAKLIQATHAEPGLGSDPTQIKRVAETYGLSAEIREGMSLADLEDLTRRCIPVTVVCQAWREDDQKGKSWTTAWDNGHYMNVIGVDEQFVYLEDPALSKTIGWIPRAEFLERWHDVGRDGRKWIQMGIAFTRPGYSTSAERTHIVPASKLERVE